MRAPSSRALPSRLLAYTLSILIFSGFLVVLPAPPARAATALTITPLNWDVIGLDSNKPQSSAITKFVQRFKVCNADSSTTADGVKTTWTWGTGGSTKISLVNGTNTDGSATDRTIGSLAPGACAITSYNLDVATAPRSQSFPATPNTRPYTVGTTTTTSGFGSTTALSRRLYVQKLVSQSRNAIVSTSWSSVTDGTNPCSSATACTVHENEKYRVTLIGKTSTGYLQTEQILNIPDNVFEVLSIKTTFAIPGVTINSEYADACGWAAPPTTTSPGSCIGPPGVPGGKAGGNPIKTVYTLKALSNASSAGAIAMNPMILDNSGGSYHYNSDVATDAITITPVKSSDLSITKTHANSATSNAFIRGTSGTTSSGNRYVVTITNNGPTATTGTITMSDTLPTGLSTAAAIGTSVSGTGQGSLTWSCPAAGATTISCTTSGSLVSGGSATLTIPITVPSGQAKGQVSNTATVSIAAGASNSVDPKASNNSATDPTTIAESPDADLILTNTHTGNFTRGGTATWNLSLKNDGPSDVTSPQVTSTLPTGVTYTGFTGTNWSCSSSGQVVTCTYSAGLNSGITANSLAISGTVAASAGDTLTNVASATATIASPGVDANSANNTNISDTAVVGQADMSLSISHTGNLTINSTGTFDFAVTNSGPDAANSPNLLFTLPPKMTYSSVNTAGWSCSGSPASPTTTESQVVTCTRATAISSGATSTVNVTVNIHSTATEGELFAIISGITCSGAVQSTTVSSQTVYSCPVVGGTGFTTYDPDTTNNYADDAANSYSPADMGVTATATASITAGNDITYTVTVTNNGPNSATNPFFALTLPNGVTFNATSPSNSNTLSNAYTSPATPTSQTAANFTTSCSYSEAEIVCPPSGTTTLLSGQSFRAQILGNTSATTTPGGGAAVVATAQTGADQGDTNSANDSATASTTVTGGNVPPVVAFTGSPTTSVNESSTATYTYNWTATDSTASVSSFTASCGSAGTKVGGDTITAGGTGTTSVSGSFVCKFDDGPQTSDVTVNATDNQALTATATTTVTVSNVAPTGTFNAPSTASTNATFTVSIASGADASAADTSSGFTYSFDCGSGTFSDFSTATSLSCTAPSSAGNISVYGKIKDKDGGITTYGPTTVSVVSGTPTADAQSVATNEDANKLVTLTATDAQGDSLTYKVTSLPSNGKLYVGNATTDEITSGELPQTLPGTQVTFVPNANYNNGSGASGNTFQFKATDGTNESTAATITIDVDPVNDTPAAANTTITTSSGSATVNLATITTDVETTAANHTYKITALPAEGTLKDGSTTIASVPYTMANGTIVTYLQPANDTSDDSFIYTATDRGDPDNCGAAVAGQCTAIATDPGTVTIDVTNAAPTATAQSATTNEDTNKLITLAGTDPEGDSLIFKVTSVPANGTLYKGNSTASADTISTASLATPVTLTGATVTFKPDANFNNGSSAGPNFKFIVTDSNSQSAEATVTIDVDPVNDVPVAADTTITTSSGAATITRTALAGLVTDVETTTAANHVLTIESLPSAGTLANGGTTIVAGDLPYTVASGVTLTYTQPANRSASSDTSFTYKATDRGDPDNCGAVVAGACVAAQSDTGTITVDITNAAPVPVLAGANPTTVAESGVTERTYSWTASDPEGDTISTVSTSCGAAGTKVSGSDTSSGGNTSGTFKCIFADGPASSTVSVTATDSLSNQSAAATQSVTVTNVAPTVTVTGDGQGAVAVAEDFSYTITDPGDDTFPNTAADDRTISCGTDGTVSAETASANGGTFKCTYTSTGTKTVTVMVHDSDGAEGSDTDSMSIVANTGPIITWTDASNIYTHTEHATTTRTFSYSASDSDGINAQTPTVSCGTGGSLASGSNTFNATTDAGSFGCIFDDGAASPTISVALVDTAGFSATATHAVTVTNVAPTATFNSPDVNEGTNIALSLTSPSDPSATDTTAGFTYAFDCGSGYGSFSSTSSTTCSTNDNGTRSVKAKIQDEDGGVTEYTDTVTINNVAPTATLSSPDVNEGTAISLSLSSPSDVSSVDTSNGFTYAFDCGLGAGLSTFSSTATASCPTTDNGTRTVKGQIKDKDGGVTEYTDSVTISNVAPTATLTSPDVNEGTAITVSLSSPSDPSSADTTAGFTYAFDCGLGAGLSTFSSTATASCPTTDNGTRTVKGQIKDKDGGVTEYTDTVTITNVAPTASFSSPDVNEGTAISLSLSSPSDPSSADTTAGFTYAFDCGLGAGLSTFSSTATASCPTTDNGTRAVRGQIKDKDGGVTEYTDTVTISNVAPTVTVTGDATANESATTEHTYSFTVTDPAGLTNDPPTITARSCGTGGTEVSSSYSFDAAAGTGSFICKFPDGPASPDVTVSASDGDGGSHTGTKAVTVSNVAPTVAFTGGSTTPLVGVQTTYTYSISDPGADTISSVTTSCDGATKADATNTDTSGSFKCTFAGTTQKTISAQATDSDSAAGNTATRVINPTANSGPAITWTDSSNSYSVTEHLSTQRTFLYSAADTDGVPAQTPTASCGTGGSLVTNSPTFNAISLTGSFTCVFADGPATPEISVSLKDGLDNTGTETHAVTVTNVAPIVTVTGDATANESGTTEHTYSFTVTDPAGLTNDPPTITARSCGTGGTEVSSSYSFDSAAGTGSFICKFTDGPATPSVSVSASDGDSGSHTGTKAVTVSNVAPTVAFTGGSTTPTVGVATTYTYSISDPGVDTVSSVTTSCDGATKTDATNTDTSGSFKCTFSSTTQKTISAQATDSDSAAGNTATRVVDPSAAAPTNTAPTASVTLHTLPNTGAAAVLTSTQAPKMNDKVRATATCGDPDGDAVTLTFVWKVQRVGPPVTTETVQTTTVSAGSCSGSFTDTLDLSKTGFGDKGETVKVEVTPNDGKVNGTVASGSTTVVVSDTPPTATDRIIKMGVDQTRTVVLEGSDVDGESVNFTITQQPANGNVTLAADSTKDCFTANGTSGTRGSYTSPGTETCHLNASYTPASGVTGTVTFKYKVENSDAGSRIATVTIEIQANPQTGTEQTDDAEQETVQGALVTTGSAPSTDDPVETQIVAVRNGRIIIREEPIDQTPPSGFSFFAQQIDIQVLDANDDPVTTTASEPQRFTFLLDPSMLPSGKTVADIEIYRNGTKVSACTGGSDFVQPTPACVLSRTLASGIIQIEVLTTAASTWHFAFPVAPSGGGGVPISDDLVATGGTDLPVISPNGDGKFDIVTFDGTVNRTVTWVLDFLRTPSGGQVLASATDTSTTARAPWGGTTGGEVLPDGVYYWRLTGSDATGRSFAPVVGEVEIDTTPPPMTDFSFKGRSGQGALIRFEMGEAGTVAMSVMCGDETIKTFATRTIATPKQVEYNWYTATPAQMRDVRRGDCGVVITTEDDVANDATYRPSLQQRLPGPLIRLFASSERPEMGQTVRLRTRLARCRGQENDRVELWRRLPGEDHFTRVKGKHFSADCKAIFVITMKWERVEFRTIWPKQNANYRRGRAEPVLLVARSST